MAKCIFDKKANIKGYRKCEITGQIKKYRCCDNWCPFNKPCKYFTPNCLHRFIDWLYKKL